MICVLFKLGTEGGCILDGVYLVLVTEKANCICVMDPLSM
jgi:hypothetical protein